MPSIKSCANTVLNGSSGANLVSSGGSNVDPVLNPHLVTDPVPSTSSAMIPPINVNLIQPDPDNDDIKIIEVCSNAEPAEKRAEVASKSNESQKGIKETEDNLTNPCKIIITSIQSIRPNSSLDRSIKENYWIRNHLQNKETETNSHTSSDSKNSSHNPKKEPESNLSGPKLNLSDHKISQPQPKPKNLLENCSGQTMKQSNKENVQYGLLPNGHNSSTDNVEIKEEPMDTSTDSIKELELSSAKNSHKKINGVLESKLNGSISSVMTNRVSKHCDNPVAKNSIKIQSSKKGKNFAETSYASDDELYVVAEILNSDGSNLVEHPKSIKEEPKTDLNNQPYNHKASTSSPVTLNSVEEEGKRSYSEFDIVCLSSDEEDEGRFPCSQLFDSVEKDPVVKQEPTDEGENGVLEPETPEDENVILLSDSDDDNESIPWYHRLSNSQVYRPSQDFLVKTKSEEAEQTNEVDQSGLDAILGLDEEDLFKKVDDLDTSWKDELPQTEVRLKYFSTLFFY